MTGTKRVAIVQSCYIPWKGFFDFASGVTLLLGVMLLFMGTVLVSLGVLGTYVFRTFQEVLGRPRYLVAEALDAEPLAGGEARFASLEHHG